MIRMSALQPKRMAWTTTEIRLKLSPKAATQIRRIARLYANSWSPPVQLTLARTRTETTCTLSRAQLGSTAQLAPLARTHSAQTMWHNRAKEAISAWAPVLRSYVRPVRTKIRRSRLRARIVQQESTAMEPTRMRMELIALLASTVRLERSTSSSTRAQEVPTTIKLRSKQVLVAQTAQWATTVHTRARLALI